MSPLGGRSRPRSRVPCRTCGAPRSGPPAPCASITSSAEMPFSCATVSATRSNSARPSARAYVHHATSLPSASAPIGWRAAPAMPRSASASPSSTDATGYGPRPLSCSTSTCRPRCHAACPESAVGPRPAASSFDHRLLPGDSGHSPGSLDQRPVEPGELTSSDRRRDRVGHVEHAEIAWLIPTQSSTVIVRP